MLAVAMRGVDLSELRAGLSQASPAWVVLAFVTVLLTTAAKAFRWQVLFPSAQRPGLLLLAKALMVGQMANALLPARAGDVARVYLMGAEGETSRATALGTMAAEKAFDVLLLLLCAAGAATAAALPAWLSASLVSLAAAGGFLVAVALFVSEDRLLGWADRWSHLLPWSAGDRLAGLLLRGLAGLASLRNPAMAALAGAWSVVVWALSWSTNYVLFRAFNLDLPAGAALLVLVLLQVGTSPPSTPIHLGVFHALTLVALSALGVDSTTGLAYATVLHATVYLPKLGLGALALGQGRVRLRGGPLAGRRS